MVPKLLVVDDCSDNFQVIKVLLSNESYQLDYVPGGEEALEYLEINRPDLVLMDIRMPKMNGFTLCGILKIHPEWKHIPIIAITALPSHEALDKCLSAGADDFISKPVDGTELRARIRAMLRIRGQYERLHDLLALQDDLTHMVVHDLRSPLTSIAMSTSVLARVVSEPLHNKQVKRILASINRLHCMVDSVLMLGKLKAERMALQLQLLDVTQLIEEAREEFQLLAEQRSIRFDVNVPEQNIEIWADPLLLRRVVDNLISNAIKFSGSEGEVWVNVSYPEQKSLRIDVFDHGPGVSKELKERLFQKFETENMVAGVKQTGLGLAFCKMAVEAHNGKISVQDNQPRGSVFTVEIGCGPQNSSPLALG